jgi:hypothetical protein
VVPRCLELRIHEEELSRKRAIRWKWINRAAFVVVAIIYFAEFWSVNTHGLRLFRTSSTMIPVAFLFFCEFIGKNHISFDSDGKLLSSNLLAIAGWVALALLAAAIKAMVA